MGSNSATLEQRIEASGGEIAAARARLAERADFEDDEAATFSRAINRDFEAVTHENEAAAHAAYDRIEARLVELQPLLSVLPR